MRHLLICALGAALLAGCGGGGATPGTTHASTSQTSRVTFKIDVPPGSLSAHRRSAQYISPATTQLSVDIRLSGYSVGGFPMTVPLTPGSSDCTTTISTTYCQFSVNLSFGSYTAIITAEDANNTPLSASQMQFTVLEGQTIVPLTLSGIPAKLQIAPGALAVHGPSPSGFTLYGTAQQNLVVAALDADGNIIVGPGAPTFTASVLSGSGWSVGTPASTSPNVLPVTPPGTNGSGATVQVTANYSDSTCQATGAVCTTSFTIKNDIQTLYAGNYGNSTVTEYQLPYTGGASATISVGVSGVDALAVDAQGDLFVANFNNSTVTVYPPGQGAPSVTITNGIAEPERLLVSSSGTLFVSNELGPTVTVYTPPYTGTPTTITGFVGAQQGLALDSAGDLFTSESFASTVREFAPPYTGAPVATITNSLASPQAVAIDAAGNLFVPNVSGNDAVEEFAPPYTGSPVSIGSAEPVAMLIDPAGNLFVSGDDGHVYEYAPGYSAAPTVSPYVGTGMLLLDGTGNLMVTNNYNTISILQPPYSGPVAATIGGLDGVYSMALSP